MYSKFKTDINNYSSFVPAKTKEGLIMIVNPNDQYISRSLMYTGEWEPHITNILKSFLKEGMTMIDVGANIGAHTLISSKLVGNSGKVFAFEPCKINHDILIQNCLINKCSNTIIFKLGCSDNSNNMFIDQKWNKTNKEDNYGCITLQPTSTNENDEQIDIISLDELLTNVFNSSDFEEKNKRIDLIKIDAEGMEDKVLLGFKKLIEKYKPFMIVEIHPGELKDVRQIIENMNYQLKQIGGIDFIAIPN